MPLPQQQLPESVLVEVVLPLLLPLLLPILLPPLLPLFLALFSSPLQPLFPPPLLPLLQPLLLPLLLRLPLPLLLVSFFFLPFVLLVLCHLPPRRLTSRQTTRRSNKTSWEAQT